MMDSIEPVSRDTVTSREQFTSPAGKPECLDFTPDPVHKHGVGVIEGKLRLIRQPDADEIFIVQNANAQCTVTFHNIPY